MNNAMTINTALAELRVFARDEINATAISVGCLRAVAHRTLKEIQDSGDHVSVRTIDAGIPGFSFVPRFDGLRGAQILVAQVAEGGKLHARITQQLVVTLYTGWEHHHRDRIASAHGVDRSEILHPYFGDLRLLRHDIVHHRGTASTEHSVRCEGAVLHRSLQEGDLIYVADDELMQLTRRANFTELSRGSSG